MLRNALAAISFAARSLLRDWRVAALFSGVCASLLSVCYFFAVTKEATIVQVLLTLALALAAVLLFYTLQAMSVSYTRGALHADALCRQSLKNSWRLMLATVPLIILALFVAYLATQTRWRELPGVQEFLPAARLRGSSVPLSTSGGGHVLDWNKVALASLQLAFFAIVLPLSAIHLWISAAHDGLRQTLKTMGRVMVRAFDPQPVLVYTIGLVLFGLIPCLLFFTKTPATNAWLEVGLFIARLALGFLFLLFGWVVTLGALAKMNRTKESADA